MQVARHENRPRVGLVVEDEDLLRSVPAELLRHADYTVVEASNAAEAVLRALTVLPGSILDHLEPHPRLSG
jgi:CheY-like chemotaxis protein